MSLAAALALTVFLSAPDPAAVRRAAQQVAQDGAMQTTRPRLRPLLPPPPSRGGADDGGRGGADRHATGGLPDRTREPPGRRGSSGHGLAGLVTALMWAAIVVVVALLLVSIVTAWRDRGARPPPRARAPIVAPQSPEEVDLKEPLDRATALASAGRYAEAAHTLLLDTMSLLAATSHLPDSWTSREVLGRLDLGAEAHGALQNLIQVAENSLFGGRDVDAEVYGGCVQAFRRFKKALAA